MRALSRLVWAILRNARAPSTLDCASATWLRWVSIWLRAAASCASAAASDACEDSAFVFALSRSIAAISPRPWRSSSRAAFRASLLATVRALTRFASWLTALAFADSRFDSATFRLAAAVATAARACSTAAASSGASTSTRSWPSLTKSPRSAPSRLMYPLTFEKIATCWFGSTSAVYASLTSRSFRIGVITPTTISSCRGATAAACCFRIRYPTSVATRTPSAKRTTKTRCRRRKAVTARRAPRPAASRRPVASGVPRLPALVALAQHFLVELADARLGHRVDDLDVVRQRPLGDLGPEVVDDLGRIEPRAGLRHDARQRPLDPLRVRHGDDGRLEDLRVRHDHVLEVDARDPLAAGLDQVLRAVGDLHVALGVDRRDVARPEPAVFGEPGGRLRVVVVGAGDPGAAHLELAHARGVPRQLATGVVHDADVHPDRRVADARAHVVLRVLGPAPHVTLEPCDRAQGPHLRHAPGVRHDHAELVLEGELEVLGRRRAADRDRAERGDVPALLLAEILDGDPDRWHRAGERDTLVLDQLADVARLGARPGEDLGRPHHHARERQAPGIGVEHGDDVEDRVVLRDPERVGERLPEAVQEHRPVGVHDRLRAPRGARGVAHARRVGLREPRPARDGP